MFVCIFIFICVQRQMPIHAGVFTCVFDCVSYSKSLSSDGATSLGSRMSPGCTMESQNAEVEGVSNSVFFLDDPDQRCTLEVIFWQPNVASLDTLYYF